MFKSKHKAKIQPIFEHDEETPSSPTFYDNKDNTIDKLESNSSRSNQQLSVTSRTVDSSESSPEPPTPGKTVNNIESPKETINRPTTVVTFPQIAQPLSPYYYPRSTFNQQQGGGDSGSIPTQNNNNNMPITIVEEQPAPPAPGPPVIGASSSFGGGGSSTGNHRHSSSKTKKSRSGRHRGRSNSDIPQSVIHHQDVPGTPQQQQRTSYYGPYGFHQSYGVNMPPNGSYGGAGMPYPTQQYSGAANLTNTPTRATHTPPSTRSIHTPPLPTIGRSTSGNKDERSALLNTKSERRLSTRRNRERHRKALSGSAAVPGSYGAFWNGTPDESQQVPPPPPPPPIQPQSNRQFSPRAEFRKLTQGMSPTNSPGRKSAAGVGGVLDGSYVTSSTRSVGWSPHTTGSMPQTPPLPPFMSLSERIPGQPYGGGEALSFFQQPSHRTSPKHHESTRKMHMRQQSAQLYMEEAKGIEQPVSCRNVLFLLLFVFHLLFVVYLGQMFGYKAFQHPDYTSVKGEVTINYYNMTMIAVYSGLFAISVSLLLLLGMTIFARHVVKISLFLVIAMSFIWGTVGIGLSPKTIVPVTGIIALFWAVAYTFIVWDRIPFASSNLLTAMSAIRNYPGVMAVAFGFQLLSLGWSIFYAVAVLGIYDAIQEETVARLTPQLAYVIYVLLGFSFYWTIQVMQGAVQAITAGVIRGWWLSPEDGGHVRQSCFKVLFYSMGSICFGSLFVGPVRFIKQLSVLFRPSSDDGSSLMCLHECIHCVQTCLSSCVDTIGASVNAWAFTYIGMYQYGFLDAGYHATDMFEKRGWTTIVSDDLVPNVLFLTSLVIGGITGCFAHFISQLDKLKVTEDLAPGIACFVEGIIIGLVLPSVVFSLITSAVNAVLVCFASSPVDFEKNHEELSHEMRSAWREVWPGALDVNDIQLFLSRNSSSQQSSSLHSSLQNSPYIDPTTSYQERHPLL